jgi:hypothetical protein
VQAAEVKAAGKNPATAEPLRSRTNGDEIAAGKGAASALACPNLIFAVLKEPFTLHSIKPVWLNAFGPHNTPFAEAMANADPVRARMQQTAVCVCARPPAEAT